MRNLLLGPISQVRSSHLFFIIILVIILTLVTEVGGFLLWIAFGITAIIRHFRKVPRGVLTTAIFILLYSICSTFLLPTLAPIFGKVPLNCFSNPTHPYEANSPLFCALNRHYVNPGLKKVLEELSVHMASEYPNTTVSYLDANFPLLNSVPLLPHLSHNDGKKLDLAFFYQRKKDNKPIAKGGAWFLGYFAFSPAWSEDIGHIANSNNGIFRWNVRWLQSFFKELDLDNERTSELVRYLCNDEAAKQVQRVFIEPYLKKTLNVHSDKIRFAGRHAARHDDHVHIQIH